MSEIKERVAGTPGRKPGTLNSVPTPYEQLPPIETLNPDNLKDLDKHKLQLYLKNHNIVPAVTKPEMKKQMRTLIHSITNKDQVQQQSTTQVIPPIFPHPSQPTPMNINPFNPMFPTNTQPPNTIVPQQISSHQLTVQQQIQQQLYAQAQAQNQAQLYQQQLLYQQQQQQAMQAQLYQQQLLQQQQQQQALAEIQRQREIEIQFQKQQQQQQQALEQQQQQSQQLLLQQQQQQLQQQLQLNFPQTPKNNTTTNQNLNNNITNSNKRLKTEGGSKSPPLSPRSLANQQAGEQCGECKAKKANKECNNKRCRGCCIRHMVEKKSDICYLHLRDESRRPRIKDPAQTEVVAELIAQAQKEAAINGITLSGSRDNSQSNTPNTNTPTLSSKTGTPILDSPNLFLEDDKETNTQQIQPSQHPQQIQPSQQPQQIQQIQPPQQQHIQPPPQQHIQPPPQQQTGQDIQQHKNDSFGRKIQSYYNNYYIGVQAQVAACSNPKRLSPAKDDRYSFFSCYHCDKVVSVNGFHLWRHIQTEHKEDFFKFVKECMKTDTSSLFNNNSSIYNSTKQKTTDRFNLIIQWLEELFSPIPSPDIPDKEFFKQRMSMLLDFESRLNELIDSFDKRIDPETSKYSPLEEFLKDSETFHKYYDGLSLIKNNKELEDLILEYESEKDCHFEQRPLLITPYQPSISEDGKRKAAFEIIESGVDQNSFSYHSF